MHLPIVVRQTILQSSFDFPCLQDYPTPQNGLERHLFCCSLQHCVGFHDEYCDRKIKTFIVIRWIEIVALLSRSLPVFIEVKSPAWYPFVASYKQTKLWRLSVWRAANRPKPPSLKQSTSPSAFFSPFTHSQSLNISMLLQINRHVEHEEIKFL